MNEQFETQNPVENTVTPANQMETPTPEALKKKGNKIAIIAGVVAAVVVAGGVGVFAAVKTGAFLSPSKKVLLAGAKTVSDMGSLGETLKDCVSLYSDEYTLKMDFSMNEGDISMEGRSSKEQKQIKGNLNISGAPSIDFLADIGADSVQVEVPTISDHLFTYDYRNEKSGYLLEMVDQDTLDAVDATLKAAYDNQNSDEFRKKMLKVYADEYNTLEFSKVDAKDFTIDGTERSCKGYQTVVTKENVNHVIDGLETLYGEDYQELMDALDLTAADFVASMREAVEEFDDSVQLRTLDPFYMQHVGAFMHEVGKQLQDLQITRGGNIIMVQVENEYGSYGTDKPYVSAIRDTVRAAGFTEVPLFQCDWSSNFTNNALDDLIWTVNCFGL